MWLCHVCDSVCVTACVTAYLTNPNDAVGTCQKGAKCKFSHDMSLANKSEKRSLYTTEEDGKAEGKFIFLKAGTDYCYPTFAVPSGTWWYLVVLGAVVLGSMVTTVSTYLSELELEQIPLLSEGQVLGVLPLGPISRHPTSPLTPKTPTS